MVEQEQQRQYIWLIRYGKTYPGLIENVGNYDSDLHEDGVNHAKCIAQRMLKDIGANKQQKIHMVSDPFLRCMRTADEILKVLRQSCSSALDIKVEEGTTEWQVSSLLIDTDGNRTNPRTLQELITLFPETVDSSYVSVNPQGPDRTNSNDMDDDADGSPRFPESEPQLFRRCRTTLQKLFKKLGDTDSIVVVGHAPCVQAMALALETGGADPTQSKIVKPWSLGGITLFSRPVGGVGGGGDDEDDGWRLEYFNSTSHMPEEYQDGKLGAWSLSCFS